MVSYYYSGRHLQESELPSLQVLPPSHRRRSRDYPAQRPHQPVLEPRSPPSTLRRPYRPPPPRWSGQFFHVDIIFVDPSSSPHEFTVITTWVANDAFVASFPSVHA